MKRVVIAAMAVLLPSAGAAQDCLDQVEKFAREFGVSTDVPQAGIGENAPGATEPSADQPSSSDLAESGGVIAPPPTGSDMPTFEPPPTASRQMPTAPEIAPGEGGDLSQRAAKDAQIEALLVAARQAAEAGDNQRCLDRLQEAVAIASDNGG